MSILPKAQLQKDYIVPCCLPNIFWPCVFYSFGKMSFDQMVFNGKAWRPDMKLKI